MTRLRDIQYHVVTYSADANGGPGPQKLELDPDALNIRWERGVNQPATAVLTLTRFSDKLAKLLYMQDHIKIWRECSAYTKPVFSGKIIKPSKGARDGVVFCWDYLSFLARSRTGFRTLYQDKLIGSQVVQPEWVLAKGVGTSPFAFVTNGAFEDPLGLDGVTPILTNEQFGVIDFDRLTVFQTLAEMSMANTDNVVVFEITHETPHTFNFWKNRSTRRTNYDFSYPGNLIDVDHDPGYDRIEDDLATVIIDPTTGAQTEYVLTDAPTIALYRRLQGAAAIKTLFGLDLGTSTETDMQKTGLARLLTQAIAVPKLITLFPRQGEYHPFDGHELGDTFRIRLQASDRIGTDYDAYSKLLGVTADVTPNAGEVLTLYAR